MMNNSQYENFLLLPFICFSYLSASSLVWLLAETIFTL